MTLVGLLCAIDINKKSDIAASATRPVARATQVSLSFCLLSLTLAGSRDVAGMPGGVCLSCDILSYDIATHTHTLTHSLSVMSVDDTITGSVREASYEDSFIGQESITNEHNGFTNDDFDNVT